MDTVANATLPGLPIFFVGLSRIDQLKIGVLTPVYYTYDQCIYNKYV